MYAVSSEIGCTAINGAMAIDIPAGGQSVILALDKKIVIDGDDTAKFVEVRWGTNTAVGSRPVPAWLSDVLAGLISIVGDDNFDINYVPAENKVYLVFSLDTTVSQVAEVKSLLDRVLPSNVVTDMEWADGLPTSYTRLEYIQTITGKRAYIDTGYKIGKDVFLECDVCASNFGDYNVNFAFGAVCMPDYYRNFSYLASGVGGLLPVAFYWPITGAYSMSGASVTNKWGVMVRLQLQDRKFYYNGVLRTTFKDEEWESVGTLGIGPVDLNQMGHRSCRYGVFRFGRGDVLLRNFTPVLSPSGVPGMYDTVEKIFMKSATTESFAAGLSLQQVREMKLPVPGEVNTLYLSIPYEAYNDPEAWGAIESAQQKGWTFTFYWADIFDYFTSKINAIVGAGNYKIFYNQAGRKLSLEFAANSVTNEQIAEVESVLTSLLPPDLDLEIAEMPKGYRRLEYIENPSNAFINLDKSLGWDYEIESEYFVVRAPNPGFSALIGHVEEPRQVVYVCRNNNGVRYDYNNGVKGANMFTEEYRFHVNIDKNVAVFNNLTTNETATITLPAGEFEQPTKVYVFAAAGATGSVHYPAWIRLYSLKGSRGGVPQFDFIPVLDEGKAPCLFDKVSRKVYYSAAAEADFTYPGAPTQATTYSLRRPTMYAQYTEHGIRRLYGVPEPEGYDGTTEGVTEDYNSTITLEEYAAANGFKELVVPPMPETGYWIPEWHETDTQLICEWVETEAPTEEALQIEDTENA